MSDGREKPDIPIDPGSVVEGAKKAIHGPDPDDKFTELVEEFRRKLLHIPDENFADGVRAEKTFREDVCPNGRHPLGPFIPTNEHHRGDTREVGGVGRYLLFPDFMSAWFDEQTPETLAALGVLSRKQIRKTIFNQIIKENWIRASLVFSFVVGCVQYGAQVVEWVLKNLPAIRSAWQLLRAGAGQ